MKEYIVKLRKAADALEALFEVNTNAPQKKNETKTTAKQIIKGLKNQTKKNRKLRNNPWDNPQYRKKMLVRLADARRKALRNRKK